MALSRPVSPHLVPIHLYRSSCSLRDTAQDPRLAAVLTDGDLRDMEHFAGTFLPKAPWWSVLSLWVILLVPVPIVLPPLLQSTYPYLWAAWPVYALVLCVCFAADLFIFAARARRYVPAARAQLEHLNVDWRARRGFQLVLREPMGLVLELGRQHREPLTEHVLDFGADGFSGRFSLAVEELCGSEYAERQYLADVERLNRVPRPRWQGPGLLLTGIAPILLLAVYFGIALAISALAPAASDVVFGLPLTLTAVSLALASAPVLSFFRRRQTRQYMEELRAVVEELQMFRGREAGEWRWQLRDFSQLLADSLREQKASEGLVRAYVGTLSAIDKAFHLGLVIQLKIVAGDTASRDDEAHDLL